MANRNDLARQFRRRRQRGEVGVLALTPPPSLPRKVKRQVLMLRERLARAFNHPLERR